MGWLRWTHATSNTAYNFALWRLSFLLAGTYKIEAYLSDGTFLWSRDLGWSIEQGIWYSPMVVYDLDGDGAKDLLADFIDHILDGSDMKLSQADSFTNSRVVIRAQEAATSGEAVKV